MRHSLTCPKCDGRKFYAIERMQSRRHDETDKIAETGVACARVNVTPPDGESYALMRQVDASVFVCTACGFVEFYA